MIGGIPTAQQVADDAVREATTALLSHCTDKQRALFDKIYPGGPSVEKLHNAYDLVRRTVNKNRTGDIHD